MKNVRWHFLGDAPQTQVPRGLLKGFLSFFRSFFLSFFLGLFVFLGPHPQHMEVPRLGVESDGAVAAGLCHSYSNARSEPHLRPAPQLMTTPDP